MNMSPDLSESKSPPSYTRFFLLLFFLPGFNRDFKGHLSSHETMIRFIFSESLKKRHRRARQSGLQVSDARECTMSLRQFFLRTEQSNWIHARERPERAMSKEVKDNAHRDSAWPNQTRSVRPYLASRAHNMRCLPV